MVIKDEKEVPFKDIPGYKGVKKAFYIGPSDGSDEIVMRYFSVAPGGNTPYHSHNFPHLVKVEKGQGVAIDSEGAEHRLTAGQLVYLHDNEVHGFKNTGTEPFDFLCIVPIRGEK